MNLTDRALFDAWLNRIKIPIEVVYYWYACGYGNVLYLVVAHVVNDLHESPECVRFKYETIGKK